MSKALDIAQGGGTGTFSGAVDTDATYVDAVIFGPARDGVQWDEKQNLSVVKKLMVATVKDAGADSTVEIWDATDSNVVGGTALASVTITGAATPTGIAASMGYIIVGSEDGVTIIDPHDGSWAERTVGWPRSLSTSTTPALGSNAVTDVSAGTWDTWPSDPRTGGNMPCFGYNMSSGAAFGVIKYDGNVWDRVTAAAANYGSAIVNGYVVYSDGTSGDRAFQSQLIETMTADNWSGTAANSTTGGVYGLGVDNGISARSQGEIAYAAAAGLTIGKLNGPRDAAASFQTHMNAAINRTYNTGYMIGDVRGAWLANSATADRSYKANTLTENGTVTSASADGASGELLAYSGFSASNYLTRATDTDFDWGSGNFCIVAWFKLTASGGYETIITRGATTPLWGLRTETSGAMNFIINDGSGFDQNITTATFADSEWHMIVAVKRGTTNTEIWVDGKLERDFTIVNATATLTVNESIGIGATAAAGNPWANGAISMIRVAATAPSAAQIRAMYDAEKGMFETAAKVLLQSGTTDAVLDVDVDPVSGKVAVTQTDDKGIWDGLVYTNVADDGASSAFEHMKLWGNGRFSIGATDSSISMPTESLRELTETVKGLGIQHEGIDLGKAKAWIYGTQAEIRASHNIESISVASATVTAVFGTPFKGYYVASGSSEDNDANIIGVAVTNPSQASIYNYTHAGAADSVYRYLVVFFGELEGE